MKTGSRLDRFVAFLKKQKEKFVKKVKSVWKEYKEVIVSAGIALLAVAGRIFVGKLAKA